MWNVFDTPNNPETPGNPALRPPWPPRINWFSGSHPAKLAILNPAPFGAVAPTGPGPLLRASAGGQRLCGPEPILLGLTVALTGPNATSFQPTINAFNYGVQQINAKGGVLGRQLKLDIAGIGATPAEGLAAVPKLLAHTV